MAGLNDLRQLATQIHKRQVIVAALNKEEESFKAKYLSMFSPVTSLKAPWKFELVRNWSALVGMLGLAYFVIYIIGYVLVIIGAIVTVPLYLFKVNTSFLDKILYYLGYPATWFGGLVLPWVRNAGLKPNDVGLDHIGYFFVSLLLLLVVLILVLFVIDLIIMLLRNPYVATANKKIRAENVKNQYMEEFVAEEWMKSDDCKTRERKIKEIRVMLVRASDDVNRNTVLHKDYKSEEIVLQLIDYMEHGRAGTVTDAINLMHRDRHFNRMAYIEQERLEEARRQRIAIEKNTEYQRQSNELRRRQLEIDADSNYRLRKIEINSEFHFWDRFFRI